MGLEDAKKSAGKNEPFRVLAEPLATQANETCKHMTHATLNLVNCVIWIITSVITLVFWIVELLITFPSKVLVWEAKIWAAFARQCEFPPGLGNYICAWAGIMQLGWHKVAICQLLKDNPSPKDLFMSALLVFQIDVLTMINDADNDEKYKAGFQTCKTTVKTFFKENLYENDQAINRCWCLFACMHKTPFGWITRCVTWFGMYFVATLGIHLVYKACKSFMEPKEAADKNQPASHEQQALTQ